MAAGSTRRTRPIVLRWKCACAAVESHGFQASVACLKPHWRTSTSCSRTSSASAEAHPVEQRCAPCVFRRRGESGPQQGTGLTRCPCGPMLGLMLSGLRRSSAGRSTMRRHNALSRSWRHRVIGRRTSIYVWTGWAVLLLVVAGLHLPSRWALLAGVMLGGSIVGWWALPEAVMPGPRWRLFGVRTAVVRLRLNSLPFAGVCDWLHPRCSSTAP